MTSALALIACGGSGGGGHSTDGGTAGTPVTFVSKTAGDSVAFQDGSGAWVSLAKVAGTTSTYRGFVKDPSGKYGFAVSTGGKTHIYQATLAEAPALDLSVTGPATANVDLTVAGLNPDPLSGDKLEVFHGPYVAPFIHNGTVPAPLAVATAWDAVGFHRLTNPANSTYIFHRDLPLVPSGPLQFDVSGSSAVTAEALPVPSGAVAAFASKNNTVFQLPRAGSTVYAPPASSLVPGDRFLLLGSDTTAGVGGSKTTRIVTMETDDIASVTTFPKQDPITAYSVTAVNASKGVYRINFTVPGTAAYYEIGLDAGLDGTVIPTTASLAIHMSPGWAGSGTVTYTTPDLTAIPAFASNAAKARDKASVAADYAMRPFSSFLRPWGLYEELTATGTLPLGAGVINALTVVSSIPIE